MKWLIIAVALVLGCSYARPSFEYRGNTIGTMDIERMKYYEGSEVIRLWFLGIKFPFYWQE